MYIFLIFTKMFNTNYNFYTFSLKLLNQFCGTEDDLPIKKEFYTRGRVLKIIWLQAATDKNSEKTKGSGFSLILTSISKLPGNF